MVGFLVFSDGVEPEKITVSESNPASSNTSDDKSTSAHEQKIPVYVTGGVNNPGVYWVDSDSLVYDVIVAAGDISDECDTSKMEKSLNLAEKVVSGMKIYIPKIGDSESSSDETVPEVAGKININTASKSQLMSLSGIGDVYSQKIIDGRVYKTTKELVEKKIIPNATYEKIKDQISV